MSSTRTSCLLLVALFIFCFGLAAGLQPWFQSLENRHGQSTDIFGVLMGDTRYAFGDYFYRKADAYYHSGYYPTIFDNNKAFETAHMAEDTGAVTSHNQNEEAMETGFGFMGPPRDWIDAFGRHFMPNRHTHLDEGGPTDDLSTSSDVREILPWLKLSTELDPDNVQTYVVTAYWLRERMHKVPEAEQVLREGLRNNPDSYEILFELGRLYDENYHDTNRARNVWEAAVRKWLALKPQEQQDDRLTFEKITTHLAELEKASGNLPQALNWFHAAQKVSETPDALQKQIDELQQKITAQPSSTNNPAP
jgi:tetratricopeptide (TPR) repeat protein